LQDMMVYSRKAEQHAMLKEDYVEQDKRGRYYIYAPDELLTQGSIWPVRIHPKIIKVTYGWISRKRLAGGVGPWDAPHRGEMEWSSTDKYHTYALEKPGQCRCATCGYVFLWRREPKLWEILSGQVASPRDAGPPSTSYPYTYAVTFDPASSRLDRGSKVKRAPCTYGNSWYYFCGKPVTCSLCTAPACVDCSRVFRWGDQFRREVCSCGGALEMRRVTNPAPRLMARCNCCDSWYERGPAGGDPLCSAELPCDCMLQRQYTDVEG
jgi:hypothetical protein